jgi:protein SSD1
VSATDPLDVRHRSSIFTSFPCSFTHFRIPEREFELRKDLRNERVFTIDPDSAKDLDDAVSVKLKDDGTYEVGIHIADVSYFVKPNTALDRDARKRATSVYLVQRAVPMLPPTLSEQLCSLVPGQDRLAFSVVYAMSQDARVISKWIGKTVIRYVWAAVYWWIYLIYAVRSAAQLSYSNAQSVLDGKSLDGVSVSPDHPPAKIEEDIIILRDLGKHLKARRFQNGALSTDTLKLSFKLDDRGMPVDCWQYAHTDANDLIEEVRYNPVRASEQSQTFE